MFRAARRVARVSVAGILRAARGFVCISVVRMFRAARGFARVSVAGILRAARGVVRVSVAGILHAARGFARVSVAGVLRAARGFARVSVAGILRAARGFVRVSVAGVLRAARGFARVSVAGVLRAARGFVCISVIGMFRAARGFARVSAARILHAARGFVRVSVAGMFRAARGFARVSVAGILRAARGFVRFSVAGILRAARGFVFVAIIGAVGVFVHLAGFQADEDEVHAHGGLRGVFAEKMQIFARAPRVHLARLSHEHGALLAGVHRKNALPQKHGRVGSPGKLVGTMIAPAVQRAVRRKRQRKIAPARDRNDVSQHLHRLRHARVRAPGHAFPAHIGAPRPHAALLIHGQRMRAARRNRRKPLRDRAERQKQRRADCQYFSRHTHFSSPRVHPPERASFAHILPTRIRFLSTYMRRPLKPPPLREAARVPCRAFVRRNTLPSRTFNFHVRPLSTGTHAPPAETAAKSSAIMASAKDDAFPLPRVRLVGAHSSRTFNSHARLLSADAHMPRPREAPEAARSPRRAFGLSKRALCTRSILTRACSQPTHTCRPPKPSQHSEGRASHFTETHLSRDYFLPVSFSRHAAQPPSPVSRRVAGSYLPTRRIASITSSAGMISPTPESTGFAAHGAE